MALVTADRVQETTTSTGTGTITLAGAVSGYQSFAVIGNTNTTYYTITSGAAWEVGIGTYTASGTTLSRDTVLSSSAAGSKIALSGTSNIFVTYPSGKTVIQDGANILAGSAVLPVANGGTAATTAAAALTTLGAYAASNPSGYTTNTGTVTSVAGTGTVSGLSLTGSVTTAGSLTLGGTLALTSGNVTTALGFTPYNATNPSGYTTNTGTATSVSGTGTVNGISLSGTVTAAGDLTLGGALSNVSLTTQVTGVLPVARGGTAASNVTQARTNLGGTTLGSNLFIIANPSAVTFPRFNADNTASSLDAGAFRTAIGAGTMSTQDATAAAITGGAVNGTTIGATTRAAGSFTTLSATSDLSVGANIITGTGVSTGNIAIEHGGNRTGDGATWIDFHTQAGQDFNTRLLRGSGANGSFDISNVGTGSVTVSTAGAERMRITNLGRVGIGTTAPDHLLTVEANTATDLGMFQSTATSGASTLVVRNIATSGNGFPILAARQWRSSFTGGTVGQIRFDGLTTTGGYAEFASIYAIAGTNTASGAPTALTFQTMDSSFVTAERMRITPAGVVGIGTTAPLGLLDVRGDIYAGSQLVTGSGVSTGAVAIEHGGNRTGDGAALFDFHTQAGQDFNARFIRASGVNGRFDIANAGTGPIAFGTNGVERLAITSYGDVVANIDMRAPFFYDVNDTNFFLDPNGQSNLNTTRTYIGRRDANSNWNTGFSNTPAGTKGFNGDISVGGPSGSWWFYESLRHENATNLWGTQLAWGWEDNANRLQTRNVSNGGFGSWVEYLNTSGRTYSGNLNLTGSIISTASDVRAPIFYDQNDTGFYVDPNASSRIRNINLGGSTGFDATLHINGIQGGNGRLTQMSPSSASQNALNIMASKNAASADQWWSWGVQTDNTWKIQAGVGFGGSGISIDGSGNLVASGNITAFSDIRLKEDVRPIAGALSKVEQLRGVTYTRNDLADTYRRYGGLIAQDVQQVLPEAVTDNAGALSVDYNATIGLLVEAIKELKAELETLKARG